MLYDTRKNDSAVNKNARATGVATTPKAAAYSSGLSVSFGLTNKTRLRSVHGRRRRRRRKTSYSKKNDEREKIPHASKFSHLANNANIHPGHRNKWRTKANTGLGTG